METPVTSASLVWKRWWAASSLGAAVRMRAFHCRISSGEKGRIFA
jgi:hypothetical protein